MRDETVHPLLASRCRHCAHIGVPRLTLAPGGPHAAAAVCVACGGFLKYIPKRVLASIMNHKEDHYE